jgi:hypothetical protein
MSGSDKSPVKWTEISTLVWVVIGGIIGLVFLASTKINLAEQSQKDIAGLNQNVKEGFQEIGRKIENIPVEQAKVRALEARAIETREDIGKHDARLRMLEDARVRDRTDLDNLVAASRAGPKR